MARGKLARSSSAAQKRTLRVLPPLLKTMMAPASLSAYIEFAALECARHSDTQADGTLRRSRARVR